MGRRERKASEIQAFCSVRHRQPAPGVSSLSNRSPSVHIFVGDIHATCKVVTQGKAPKAISSRLRRGGGNRRVVK